MDLRTLQLQQLSLGNLQLSRLDLLNLGVATAGPGKVWPRPSYVTATTTIAWSTPQSDWVDVRGYTCAYLLVYVDALTTSGGTLGLTLQGCVAPYTGADTTAWRTLAQVTGISAVGVQVLKVTRLSSEMLTGYLRLAVTAAAATVSATIRGELILKQPVPFDATEWQPSFYLSMINGDTWTQPMPDWLDTSSFLSQYAFVDFAGTSGTNLTIYLETAIQPTTDIAQWSTVASSALASSAGTVLLDGRSSATQPILGTTRLRIAASGTASGTVRVLNLLKDR